MTKDEIVERKVADGIDRDVRVHVNVEERIVNGVVGIGQLGDGCVGKARRTSFGDHVVVPGVGWIAEVGVLHLCGSNVTSLEPALDSTRSCVDSSPKEDVGPISLWCRAVGAYLEVERGPNRRRWVR